MDVSCGGSDPQVALSSGIPQVAHLTPLKHFENGHDFCHVLVSVEKL
jgi:hypothetical protein